MNEENFLVQFIPSKNCFLQFSNKWFQKIYNSKCSCLKLIHPTTKQELIFTWAPQPSHGLNDCSVGLNATFARCLNINENELVVISTVENVSSLQQVFLTPQSTDDYDILELSRDSIEISMLNQIRVVYVGQVVSVWVSKTMHIKLTVDRLDPDLQYGRLEQLTELFIENLTKGITSYKNSNSNTGSIPHRPTTSVTQQDQHTHESMIWGIVSDYLPNSILNLLKPIERNSENIVEHSSSQSDNSQIVCRVHPFPCSSEPVDCCGNAHDETIHPFNVFVHRETMRKEHCWPKDTFIQTLCKEEHPVVLCRLETVPKRISKRQHIKGAGDEKRNENSSEPKRTVSVLVRLYRVEEPCSFFRTRTNVSCLYVSQFLRKLADFEVGNKVKLTAYSPPLSKRPTGLQLVPAVKLNEKEAKDLCEQFVLRLPCREGVLVNNHCPLPVPLAEGEVCPVLMRLSPDDLECWPLTQPELQVCPVSVAAEEEETLKSLRGCASLDEKRQITSVFEKLVEEGVRTLEFGLKLVEEQYQTLVLDNILITGNQGSGKSRVAEAICTAVSGPPHHVHISVIDCKQLKGKKPETVEKAVFEHLEECMYKKPGVLMLEDLQCIAGAPTVNQEAPQEAIYLLRLATMLKELLWRLSVCGGVSVIATAESRQQIHPQLLSPRGRHGFTTFLHIRALEKVDRLRILSELLESKLAPGHDLDLEELASKTEGCVARDLHRLVDRVLFRSLLQQETQTMDTQLQVTSEDMSTALQGFVPSSLFNVPLVHNTSHTFASVGGLQQAKELLTETLIWPTKYPEIFSTCPLRLERGVLLYGAPGTGKTLLANAVAGESGLSFITVKGPELLSKYIGASEEAVRNVFQKAQSAQPCILFFDEFDSLAPRRGHDSTGVTDRVVNQLLTQMDGVEVVEGVWVVAAASRPDLIDPALLRPGRIGKLVHCPLPDQAERLAILKSLSSKLQLSDDVDLKKIAVRTEAYTGADLQAVLYTGQMAAYDTLNQDYEDEELLQNLSPPENVMVAQTHLLSALENTKPSLKHEDRLRFQQIYERFQKSRDSSVRSPLDERSQKVTLA